MIHHHSSLARRRNPMWGKGSGAKVFMIVIWLVGLLYLAFIGVMLGFLVSDYSSVSGYEFISGILPLILLADVVLRFIARPAPSQLVRPYLLLPISKFTVVDSFLIDDFLSPFNLIWQAMFVPFALIAVLPQHGLWGFLGFIVAMQLVVEINSQWYVLVRSLTDNKLSWWILPVIVYALMAVPMLIPSGRPDVYEFFDFYAGCGKWLFSHTAIFVLAVAAMIAGLFMVDRVVEHKVMQQELTATKSFRQLTPWGRTVRFANYNNKTRTFLELEIVSLVRNKNLRKTFITTIALLLVLGLALVLLPDFSYSVMHVFWLFYCFGIFAAMFLVKIMTYEGNYIDCLMIHHDAILSLLRAKYILFSFIIFVPFIVLLPAVFAGVYNIGEVVAYALLAAGVINYGYFQLAPYNNQTSNLNSKIIGKGGTINNYIQMAVSVVVFALPLTVVSLLYSLFGHDIGNIIIAAIGLSFIALSPVWLKKVAIRMRKRKYSNLESFRATRQGN